MKPAKFIINTDYATIKNDADGTASVTLPNSLTLSANAPSAVYRATVGIGANPSAGWRCYVTSDQYGFAVCGTSFSIYCKQDGYDAQILGNIFRENGAFVLEVQIPSAPFASTTWTDMGQTLTLHLQAIIDPFNS